MSKHAYIVPRWLAIVLLPLVALPALAFDLRSNQPIHVSAQHARLDDRNNTAIYTGNVVVTQAGSKLTGDRVVIYRDKQGVSKIVATGQPAYYHEPPSPPNNPATDAHADNITYSRLDHLLVLTEKAEVKQKGNTFRGNVIRYDTQNKVVTASSNEKDQQSRVEMIIHPNNVNKSGAKQSDKTPDTPAEKPSQDDAHGHSQSQ